MNGLRIEAASALARIAEGPRVIGRLEGPEPGPTLVCVASLHGNEPAGILALERLLAQLDPAELRGTVVGLVGNRQALAAGQRYLDDDLNRMWTADRVARLRASPPTRAGEEEELHDLDQLFQELLAEARDEIFFLDLHTTSGPGPAFVPFEGRIPDCNFARLFPVPLVVGIVEELAGTMVSYLANQGARAVSFESGQHDEALAVERAVAAVWIALEAAGVLAAGRPEPDAARRWLAAESRSLPAVVEVRHRHAVAPEDEFRMVPGFASFQPVRAGQIVATDRHGPVKAPETGRILLPLYQKQGADGFFLTRDQSSDLTCKEIAS